MVRGPRPEGMITPKEACAILGVTMSTLSGWRQRGIGPRYLQYKKKGFVWYRKEDVEDWVQKHMVTPANNK